MTSQENKAYSI